MRTSAILRNTSAGLAALFAALVVCGGVAPSESQAYKLRGKKWPTRTITYHVKAPQYADAIELAAQAWNTSGVRIRFKRVSSPRRAKLWIRYGARPGVLNGNATIGYVRRQKITVKSRNGVPVVGNVPCGMRVGRHRIRCRRVWVMPRMELGKLTARQLEDPWLMALMPGLVVHEFGHVLGLDHENRVCAAMSEGSFVDNPCPKPPEGYYRCRLLEADDLRGAIRRYGGRANPLGPEFCPAPQEEEPAPQPEPEPEPASPAPPASGRPPR